MNWDITTYLAIYAALLSTATVLIKFYTVVKDRVKVKVTHAFTGGSDPVYEVYIHNISKKPVILSYWVLYKRKKWFRKDYIASPEDLVPNHKIEPHNTYTISIDPYDFPSNWNNLTFELHIIGKKKKQYKLT